MRKAILIGGGISGLSAAYQLSKAGIASTVVEQRPRLGGVIQTERRDGCVLEAGPDSFLAAKPWALELIREVGLGDDVISSNDHLRVTYLWRKGALVPLPDGLMLMVPTRILPMVWTRLLSWPTKIRMGLEFFRRPSGKVLPDRSVADFIEDHYGAETVDYLAEPLLAGVYGGDPRLLSVSSVLTRFTDLEAKYGSLTRGVLAERRKAARRGPAPPLFQTMKGGLGQLTDRLASLSAAHMEVITGTAEAAEKTAAGFRVRVNGDWLETENLVLACPAYEAAAVLPVIDPLLSAELARIPYSSSITIALGYSKQELGHPQNGFGFLVPKKERRRLVACTWVGTKFSHRVPDDKAVLRCFLGGASDAHLLNESDETLLGYVREELRDIMGVTAEPRFTQVSRWPRSMAQYAVGHQKRIAAIDARLPLIPGLYLAGNAYTGIGIPDCVRMGRKAAQSIAANVVG
jgi:protoporphyrinogen/coproporphyrinogen III oxidase